MAAYFYHLAGEPAFEPAAGRAARSATWAKAPRTPARCVGSPCRASRPDGTWRTAPGRSAPHETMKRDDMAAFLHRMDEKGLTGEAKPA